MKPSITFIMSFVSTILAFSPYAVANQNATFPKYAEAGKRCEADQADHVVAKKQETSKHGQPVYVPVAR